MGDLETARLLLHPLSADEAHELVAYAEGGPDGPGRRDSWAAGYPLDGDVSAARRLLNSRTVEGATPHPHPGAFEIRRREDGLAIGGVDFHGPADDTGSVTIGYGLVPAAQGRGYASEALRALLEFARVSGIARVKGDADHDNIASRHVMAAAGMRQVGEDERVSYYEVSWGDTDSCAETGTGVVHL
ncbi:GNAT family N-acetyltransferase [Streptomyces sp. NBC_01433]|uniref:GNAT family N-acetyltransferase n=1 Tax=Streptomyces sp. NBC_01433 TaxID=2903864 RepID=UPI002252B081|nr:GNAT family N-acetyltransferase [Streptomyces sp. NBC_01433]MCX4675429.1 GNAT family N-acetyltransferase [Streptomyces sp. NBC_01433]